MRTERHVQNACEREQRRCHQFQKRLLLFVQFRRIEQGQQFGYNHPATRMLTSVTRTRTTRSPKPPRVCRPSPPGLNANSSSFLRRVCFAFSVAAGATLISPTLHADSYPSKPITLVAVFGPGSASDTICRVIAQPLSAALNESVIVENRPGANGALLGSPPCP